MITQIYYYLISASCIGNHLNIKNWGAGVSSRVAQSIMQAISGRPTFSLSTSRVKPICILLIAFDFFLLFSTFKVLGIDCVSRRLLIHDTGVLLECNPNYINMEVLSLSYKRHARSRAQQRYKKEKLNWVSTTFNAFPTIGSTPSTILHMEGPILLLRRACFRCLIVLATQKGARK